MKFIVKKPVSVEDGKYTGIICEIKYRTEPYAYTDIFVRLDNSEFELKTGFPSNLTPNTKLGQLLSLFLGREIEVDEELDPEEILLNRKVIFMVQNEKAKDGNEYARIISGSLKPAK